MSALLTTTMPYMKVVIDTLRERGLRDDYIVLVGGAPLNEEFGTAVGADAYCRDAAVAAETAKELVQARRRLRAEPPGPVRCVNRPSIVACGALASELRAVSPPGSAEVRYLPAQLPQPPRAHRPCARTDPRRGGGQRSNGRSSPTPTAGPAARSTALLADHPGVERLPGAHCYELFAGAELFADTP